MRQPKGWYSRNYLPHFDAGDVPQFVTWRLADAVPVHVISRWQSELIAESDADRRREITLRIEAYADKGMGACELQDPRAARIVQETLFQNHGACCELHSWVIMPNHVHVVLTPKNLSLDGVIKRIKGASAVEVNRLLVRSGRLWQPGYFDRLIRTSEQFAGITNYVEWNPVKAKLTADSTLWAWSSCNLNARKRLETVTFERQKAREGTGEPAVKGGLPE